MLSIVPQNLCLKYKCNENLLVKNWSIEYQQNNAILIVLFSIITFVIGLILLRLFSFQIEEIRQRKQYKRDDIKYKSVDEQLRKDISKILYPEFRSKIIAGKTVFYRKHDDHTELVQIKHGKLDIGILCSIKRKRSDYRLILDFSKLVQDDSDTSPDFPIGIENGFIFYKCDDFQQKSKSELLKLIEHCTSSLIEYGRQKHGDSLIGLEKYMKLKK